MSPRRDVMLRRREGTRVPVEVALNSVTIHGNAFVVAAVTDLRERLEKELEIANQRNMLAHMSRVALLSELSGSLAHEINQPLTAILSNAQASVRYLDRPQPDLVEVKEGLIEVIESAKRAGEVIRRLRAMLRNDPPEMAMLDVNVAVKDVVRIVRSDLIECGVGYSVQLDEGLPMVLGDQVQLQLVLINLINNACDAMDGTGRGKHLRLSTGKAEGGVVLGVSDSGQGIPEADLARIFEPFVSSKADGLGFGLALCTTLIEAQGGRIWATNNPDVGATFHVLLREYKNDRAE
jgi:C4-dicarboxylate-specific signal transduction histidine kinase